MNREYFYRCTKNWNTWNLIITQPRLKWLKRKGERGRERKGSLSASHSLSCHISKGPSAMSILLFILQLQCTHDCTTQKDQQQVFWDPLCWQVWVPTSVWSRILLWDSEAQHQPGSSLFSKIAFPGVWFSFAEPF